MAVADLNGDGYQDILTTASNSTMAGSGFHTVEWLYNPQQQTFTKVDFPHDHQRLVQQNRPDDPGRRHRRRRARPGHAEFFHDPGAGS